MHSNAMVVTDSSVGSALCLIFFPEPTGSYTASSLGRVGNESTRTGEKALGTVSRLIGGSVPPKKVASSTASKECYRPTKNGPGGRF
jgi:hypothetical protein